MNGILVGVKNPYLSSPNMNLPDMTLTYQNPTDYT